MKKGSKEFYENLFASDSDKAKAFDKIAEKYYFTNFGSMSKSDLDTLMFSVYIEQILKKEKNNYKAFSDYILSKQLGITQSKVSNLKVKKELLYPYEDFNWRESFVVMAEKAVYEDGKIFIFIPDKNVYLEVKNAIEDMGGYVEVQLTSNLLKIRLEFFLDLLVELTEQDRDSLRNKIKTEIKKANKDIELIDKEPFGKLLKRESPEMIIDLISSCIPVLGEALGKTAKHICEIVKNSTKK